MGLFTVHNHGGGGGPYFSKHKSNMFTFVQPRGVSIFPLKHKSAMYTFVQQRDGGGPEGTHITKVCTNVATATIDPPTIDPPTIDPPM